MGLSSYVAGRRALPADEGFAAIAEAVADAAWVALNQAAALLLIVLFSPLLAAVAFAIWRFDGAPVVFAHYRVGRDGRLFRCFKFRSMCREADAVLRALLARNEQARREWARDQKLENDPRITPVGAFLRRTSLDELPQLWNVLRGEMLLVGPRPITAEELVRYGASRWHYLSVRPGLTGLWQVSGRNNLSYDERVALDRRYVEGRSVWMDLGILARTLRVVLAREGAR